MTTYGKFVPIEFCALRLTRVAADGTTPAGANGTAMLNLLGKLTLKPVYEGGNEFNPKDACGNLAITYKDRDILKRIEYDLELMQQAPEAEEILTGGAIIVDGTAKTIGRQSVPTGQAPPGNGACMEAWQKNIPAFGGAQDPVHPWVRWVLPLAYTQDDQKNLEGSPFTNAYTGFAVENASIGNGPANDFPATITPLRRSWAYFLDTAIPSTASADYAATPAQV